MGWTGGQLTGPATALNLIEFEVGADFRARVIATHKTGGVVYAAVRHHADDQVVFALVLLVERRDGLVWTKAMTDADGPAYHHCPTSILDLLSPTDNQYANRWRQRCRDHAGRPKPRPGQQVRFAEAIAFTDGSSGAVFTFLGRTRFAREDGSHVAIPRWSTRRYVLVDAQDAAAPVTAAPLERAA